MLNTKDELETGQKLIEMFCPEDNTPPVGYDDMRIMERFLSSILNYFSNNDIHWVELRTSWFDDIQEKTKRLYYY